MRMFLFVAAGAAFAFGLRWFERTSLFHPERELTFHPAGAGMKYVDLTLTASDGVAINAWHLPGKAGAPTLLFLHGNGGNLSHRVEKLKLLTRSGAEVLIIDYRGYGKSSGVPTEKGTYRDAEAAYLYLTKDLSRQPRSIFLYGESLGAAIAVDLARRRPVAGVILESPFTSILDMAAEVIAWYPARWLSTFRYDSAAKIAEVNAPLLILHSPFDATVPYRMGRRLFELAREPKVFFDLKGGHNDGYEMSGEAYLKAVESFVDRHRASKQTA